MHTKDNEVTNCGFVAVAFLPDGLEFFFFSKCRASIHLLFFLKNDFFPTLVDRKGTPTG